MTHSGEGVEYEPVVDLHRPCPGRVFDFLRGGALHNSLDRSLAAEVIRVYPQAKAAAQASRAFMHRAVHHLSSLGITQFLDLASGLPTTQPTHIAAPGAVVVYVDHNPSIVAIGHIILSDEDRAVMFEADMLRVTSLLALPHIQHVLDLSRPVGVLMIGALDYIPDRGTATNLIAALRSQLVPGSALAASHSTGRRRRTVARSLGEHSRHWTGTRTRRQFTRLLATFGPVAGPGVVSVGSWRPDHHAPEPRPRLAYAGIAQL